MGKTVIDATDGPGFLVNRCNRPFGLEALRMLSERISSIEEIDRIVRMEGGFRMGPFELMDLVGVDTGLEVSKSFYELSFGEPRWRPSPISARYAAAGHPRAQDRHRLLRLRRGRRGRALPRGGSRRPRSRRRASAEGVVVISGESVIAGELRAAASAAGFEVRAPHEPSGGVLPSLIVECDREPAEELAAAGVSGEAVEGGAARLVLCARGSLSALDPGGSAVGFHVLPSFEDARLVELTRSETSSPLAAERAERLLRRSESTSRGSATPPGLVLGRIVCQVINESAFAFGEGVGEAADIDTGMKLGLSHPRGTAGVGRRDRHRPRARRARARSAASTARSATGLRRRCAGSPPRAGPAERRARGSSSTEAHPPCHLTNPRASRFILVSHTPPPFQAFLDEHRDAVWRFLVASVGRDGRRRLLPGDVHLGAAVLPGAERASRASTTCARGC